MTTTTEPRVVLTNTRDLPPADGTCRSCSARMRWTTTTKGKRMPVDLLPVEAPVEGNVMLALLDEPDSNGTRLQSYVIGAGDRPVEGALRFRSHFATCPNAGAHRRPKSKGGLRA